jgi:hypothetical protein
VREGVGLPFSQTLFKARSYWQIVGVVTEADDGMHIEWQSDEYERPWGKAAANHVARAPIKNVLIPWSSIEKVTYRGRFFGPGQLHITARSLTAVEGLPGAVGNTWWVRVAKAERRSAREFVLSSESAIAGSKSPLLNG